MSEQSKRVTLLTAALAMSLQANGQILGASVAERATAAAKLLALLIECGADESGADALAELVIKAVRDMRPVVRAEIASGKTIVEAGGLAGAEPAGRA